MEREEANMLAQIRMDQKIVFMMEAQKTQMQKEFFEMMQKMQTDETKSPKRKGKKQDCKETPISLAPAQAIPRALAPSWRKNNNEQGSQKMTQYGTNRMEHGHEQERNQSNQQENNQDGASSTGTTREPR